MPPPGTYEALVERASADGNVVGLVLTGSRGRRVFVRGDSDWDVRLVVRDEVRDGYRSRFATPHGSTVRVVVFSLSEFEQVGEVGTESAWDRYSYVRAEVVVDKLNGRIASLVEDKSTLPTEVARSIAAEQLDDYINSYYRSAKNHRGGLVVEARLDAAESIPPLLDTLFALHGRVRPFNKFLRWELEAQPLGGEAWAPDPLLSRLEEILSTGAIGEQQSLFRDVEDLARGCGLGDVVDGWQPDVAWLRGEGTSF